MGKSKSTIIGGMESNRLKLAEDTLQEILSSKTVNDAAGNTYTLEANIDIEESRFLSDLVSRNNCKASFEIGCAYGISSLSICKALLENNGHHSIVDPFQHSEWKGIGIQHLAKAGLQNFKLIEKPSELALPELLAAGASFDFAFIDGWHTFDHTLLDMFYTNRLLRNGGIMVIDDVGMKGVQKAVNYFLNYPAYTFEGGVSLSSTSKERRFQRLL